MTSLRTRQREAKRMREQFEAWGFDWIEVPVHRHVIAKLVERGALSPDASDDDKRAAVSRFLLDCSDWLADDIV